MRVLFTAVCFPALLFGLRVRRGLGGIASSMLGEFAVLIAVCRRWSCDRLSGRIDFGP
jgi:hypothetical protein